MKQILNKSSIMTCAHGGLPENCFKGGDFESFKCAICWDVHEKDIVELNHCGHVFGRKCLLQAPKQECPVCRARYYQDEVNRSRFVERQVGQLNVNCPDCEWNGTLSQLRKEHKCPEAFIECPKRVTFLTRGPFNML